MKTNQVMKSKERILFGIPIRQQTANGHLCLTDLQTSYDKAKEEFGWVDKRVDHFFNKGTDANYERVYELLLETNFIKVPFRTFMEVIGKEGFMKFLKRTGLYQTKGRGDKRATYCNPYIWMAVALWINPKIYAKTIIWLTDGLLELRHEVGDHYPEMCSAINQRHLNYSGKPAPPEVFKREARRLNELVFGSEKSKQRNEATKEELELMNRLQLMNANLIESGIGKTPRIAKLAEYVELHNLSLGSRKSKKLKEAPL